MGKGTGDLNRIWRWLLPFNAFSCEVIAFFLFSYCAAWTSLSAVQKRGSGFFSVELIAPPLETKASWQSGHADAEFTDLYITYTNDPEVLHEWISTHIAAIQVPGTISFVGLDIEAVPFPGAHPLLKEVAVVQIATEAAAIVVQLAKSSGKPCSACHDILQFMVLENENIIKAGCGIENDMMQLFKVYEWGSFSLLHAKSRMELNGVGAKYLGQTVGLSTLAENVLGVDLPKPTSIIRSNWGRIPLSNRQVVYAARDAWVAAAITNRLALLDSETFGKEALLQQLKLQPSIRNLVWRRDKRKKAKAMMRLVRHSRRVGEIDLKQESRYLQELKQVLD